MSNYQQTDTLKPGLIWNRLPVLVRAIITGVIIAAAGTIPWAFFVRLNLDHFSSVPWSVIPASIYLWFFWKYVNGAGWPRSTAEIRKKIVRANQLSSEVWGAAIIAGILGLVSLIIFSGLLNRIVKLPQQDVSELSHVPFASMFFILLMSAAVAGVTEESAFRGYMQKPIEQRHGPVIAIFVTGIVFGLMHYTHPETTLTLMPFYIFVAVIYGTLAYITNSILPGMILHAVGNVFGGLDLLLRGQSEWQRSASPQPLIWESGADTSFWLSCAGLIVIGAITVWAYINVAKEMKRAVLQNKK
jgi:membrane protease YdiL (CAAX protease family)